MIGQVSSENFLQNRPEEDNFQKRSFNVEIGVSSEELSQSTACTDEWPQSKKFIWKHLTLYEKRIDFK